MQHTSPVPVGQGVSAIQPMDEPYPVELITPAAAGMGQITLNLFELFGSNGKTSKVWDRLGFGNGTGTTPFGKVGQGDTSQFLNLGGSSAGLNNSPDTQYFMGAVDIVDIFIQQAQIAPEHMQVVQIFRPPANPSNPNPKPSYIQYVGCVITNVQDGETIDVGTLEIIKQITVAYRYQLRDSQASQAFALRDAVIPSGIS